MGLGKVLPFQTLSNQIQPNPNMKMKLTAFLALFGVCGTSYSQTWGTTGNITVALSISYELPSLEQKEVNEFGKLITVLDPDTNKPIPTDSNSYTIDTFKGEDLVKSVATEERGTKIGVSKFANADILLFLVDDVDGPGLLPKKGKAPFIAGWSLIAVADGTEGNQAVFARHTDKTIVEVPDFILGGGESDFNITAIAEKRVTTGTFNPATGDEKTTETYSYSETFKGKGSATLPSFFGPINVTGLVTGAYKVVFKTDGTGEDKITTEVLVPGATKLANVIGVLGAEFPELVEGSISIAAGVVVDTDVLFATLLP